MHTVSQENIHDDIRRGWHLLSLILLPLNHRLRGQQTRFIYISRWGTELKVSTSSINIACISSKLLVDQQLNRRYRSMVMMTHEKRRLGSDTVQ